METVKRDLQMKYKFKPHHVEAEYGPEMGPCLDPGRRLEPTAAVVRDIELAATSDTCTAAGQSAAIDCIAAGIVVAARLSAAVARQPECPAPAFAAGLASATAGTAAAGTAAEVVVAVETPSVAALCLAS